MSYQEAQEGPPASALNLAQPAPRVERVRTTSRRPLPIPFLRSVVARAQSMIRRRPPADASRTQPDKDPVQLEPSASVPIPDWDDSVCELPVDEEVRLRSIWITEAYPPSSVPALMESLTRLGCQWPVTG
jgi:hypothetical protein